MTSQPPPIPPLDYATPKPAAPKRPSLFVLIPALFMHRTTRLIYWLICSFLLIFVIRFLLHYRQMLEDAMKQQ